MKKLFDSKARLSIAVLLLSLIVSACQPKGGELLPVAGEGIEITASRFENDTAGINEDGLKTKFYGTWSNGSYVHLRIVAGNESNQTAQIKFERANLKNGKNQVWSVVEIDEKPNSKYLYEKGADKNLPTVTLKANEKKAFDVIYAPLSNFSNADESEKTLFYTLPIEAGGKIKEFAVQFKAVAQKETSGKLDPDDQ